MKKRIHLNAFSMNCVSHIQHGLWVRDDTRQREFNRIEPWIELARLLENGGFDALFLADVIGTYDLYRGGPETAIQEAVQIPANDPMPLIPAMAMATEHLGFAFTSSVLAGAALHLRAPDLDAGSHYAGADRLERRDLVPAQRGHQSRPRRAAAP